METSANPPENLSGVPEPAPVNAPPAADSSTYAQPGAVLVIPRAIVNYVIIAIVFFSLGVIVSGAAVSALFNANSTENTALVAKAVEQAVKDAGSQGQAVAGLQQGQRYEVVQTADDPVRGAADAPVTIVEFSDFRCPYCGRFVAETVDPLLKNYDGKIKMVFRDFPILGQVSIEAALAGECMNEQGKFWEYHNLAFKNQRELSREKFISFANELGVNVAQFTSCIDDQKYLDKIRADATYAQSLGVTGTPAFFINGRFVSGAQPYQVFATMIDEELGAAGESTPEPSGT